VTSGELPSGSKARAHTRHFTPPADFAMRRVRSKLRAGQGKRAVLSNHLEDAMGAHCLSAVIRALSCVDSACSRP
jgi:hypothetical protein